MAGESESIAMSEFMKDCSEGKWKVLKVNAVTVAIACQERRVF